MKWMKVAEQATPYLQQGDLQKCEEMVTGHLNTYSSPFNLVKDLSFTNPPRKVAKVFDRFIKKQQKKISVKAIYTETNGFDINPDRWFFSLFAYREYHGHDDYDWLAQPDAYDKKDFVLQGMEKLQKIYASEDLSAEAAYLSSLLVVIKFQQLIQRAVPFMRYKDMPILATSHDYDFIWEG